MLYPSQNLVSGICLCVLFLFTLVSFTTCLESNDIRNYLGTRTPYRYRYNHDETEIKFPNCKDSQIWMLVRHGSRQPSRKDIFALNTTLTPLKNDIINNIDGGVLTKEQRHRLQTWSNNVDVEHQKDLTPEGEEEMILLAERMQKRFPNAIPFEYSPDVHHFLHTATSRAHQSAVHFAIGLFDRRKSGHVLYETNDLVLRFYKHCDRWRREVKKNDTTYDEQHLFGDSEDMKEALVRLSHRLGVDGQRNITLDEAVVMYKICGYETSNNKTDMSPWCYGFDVDIIEKLEYYHDLKHYWMDGYGYELTYKQACLAVKTIFDNFMQNSYSPNATFLFAHSGTVLKVLSHLQLFKPKEHLRADFMDKTRQWKASVIDSFAANIAFVLYKCADEDYVLTLHQEKVVKMPMCEQELCPLKTLVEYFHESIDNCDFYNVCKF